MERSHRGVSVVTQKKMFEVTQTPEDPQPEEPSCLASHGKVRIVVQYWNGFLTCTEVYGEPAQSKGDKEGDIHKYVQVFKMLFSFFPIGMSFATDFQCYMYGETQKNSIELLLYSLLSTIKKKYLFSNLNCSFARELSICKQNP